MRVPIGRAGTADGRGSRVVSDAVVAGLAGTGVLVSAQHVRKRATRGDIAPPPRAANSWSHAGRSTPAEGDIFRVAVVQSGRRPTLTTGVCRSSAWCSRFLPWRPAW
jgi:hypothetical protein